MRAWSPVLLAFAVACPGPRNFDAATCDAAGECVPGFICSEGFCVPSGECGDGIRTAGEACDGVDVAGFNCGTLVAGSTGVLGCTDACKIDTSGCVVACGDGVLAPGEACDDGNARDGDLCSSDCRVASTPILEAEPNDDGTVGVAVDDFLFSAANGPFAGDTLIAGAFADGDEDAFAITSAVAGHVAVSLHGPTGIGSCGISALFQFRSGDALGATLFTVTDGAPTGCPAQEIDVAAGASVYVNVRAADDAGPASYLLSLVILP